MEVSPGPSEPAFSREATAMAEGGGGVRRYRMSLVPMEMEVCGSGDTFSSAMETEASSLQSCPARNRCQVKFTDPTIPSPSSMETENTSASHHRKGQANCGRNGRRAQFVDPTIPSLSAMETENTSRHHTEQSNCGRNHRQVLFMDPTVSSLAMRQLQEGNKSLAMERRSVARRLVLKCISAACHRLATADRRDSIEYLISSTKRMRISSPSPSSEETEKSQSPVPELSPVPEKSQPLTLEKSQLPLPDKLNSPPVIVERCVTPESTRMQTMRKKRGRSESHEVNSLTDYNQIRQHLRDIAVGSGTRKGAGHQFGNIGEEGEVSEQVLGALAENLGMMAIDQDDSQSESEESSVVPNKTTAKMKSSSTMSPLSTFQFTAPPLSLFTGAPSSTTLPAPSLNPSSPLVPPNFEAHRFTALSNGMPPDTSAPPNTPSLFPANTTPSSFSALPSFFPVPPRTAHPVPSLFPATPLPTDPRRTANIGSVPGMDLYVIVHSCPPRGMCQKFLCSNSDEVNLVYHCWLFDSASCDPSIVLSNELALGVFGPCGVQPVHLELQDAGAPFHYIENRLGKGVSSGEESRGNREAYMQGKRKQTG